MAEVHKSREQLIGELDDLGRRLARRRLTEAREAWAEVETALTTAEIWPDVLLQTGALRDAGTARLWPAAVGAPPGDTPAARPAVADPPRATPADEGQLPRLVDVLPIGIARLDPNGRIIDCNRALQQLWQYPAEELRGKSVAQFAYPDDAADIAADLRSLTDVGETRRADRQYYRRDGSSLWVSLTIAPIAGPDGGTEFCLAVVDDITDQKQAALSLQQQNERLTGWVSELEHRTEEVSLLSEMGDLLQACRSPEEAYAVIARMARQLFPTASGAVCVIQPNSNLAEAVSIWGATVGERLFGPDACWALRRGRVHVVADPEVGLTCRHMQQPQAGASICVPMVAHGEALGLLNLSTPAGDRLSEAKQRLALTVAEHVALALANLRLHERLRSQSIRDPLTNLYNRRYMEESLDREMRRAARGRYPVGIIVLDLDHFKGFNDAFGHEAGDALLREVGGVLQRSIRGEDIACRQGGEEFALILPEASLADAARRAEQLRDAIRALNVQYRRQSLGPITVSLGVAIFPDHGPTAEAVLRAADTALYQAKDWGRDRVAVNPASAEAPAPSVRPASRD